MILNFIDGEFVASQSNKIFSKMNPFTGELLTEVTASDAMDVVRAIQAARRAQSDFAKFTLSQKAELLNKIADEIESRSEDIAFREALHQGLPAKFVLSKSVQVAVAAFREAATSAMQKSAETNSSTQQRPTGLMSFILSWNLSLRLVPKEFRRR